MRVKEQNYRKLAEKSESGILLYHPNDCLNKKLESGKLSSCRVYICCGILPPS